MPPLYPKISGISHNQVSFEIPKAGNIKLDLFDLLGRKVRPIEDGYFSAGSYNIHFDRGDLASGVYFIRLKVECGQTVVKTTIVR